MRSKEGPDIGRSADHGKEQLSISPNSPVIAIREGGEETGGSTNREQEAFLLQKNANASSEKDYRSFMGQRGNGRRLKRKRNQQALKENFTDLTLHETAHRRTSFGPGCFAENPPARPTHP